jgi:hypothetical protein
MNASIPEEEIYGLVEMLTFVAALCGDQPELLDQALFRFCASPAYPAAELAGDVWAAADSLAKAIGFPNAALDPTP